MQAVEPALKVPRVSASFIRFWFGRRTGFPEVEQLASIAENGPPVAVEGVGDLVKALAYSNHSSIEPHGEQVFTKVWDDVKFGACVRFSAWGSGTHSRS